MSTAWRHRVVERISNTGQTMAGGLAGRLPGRHDEFVDDLTRADLEIVLPGSGFAPDSYRLHGGIGANECYVLDHGPAGWEVYYSERGMKGGLRVFQTEGEACAYFLDLLRRDPTTRRQQ